MDKLTIITPKGSICQRRGKDGGEGIQYLVRDGPDRKTSKAYWIDSDLLHSPENKKEIEHFMVKVWNNIYLVNTKTSLDQGVRVRVGPSH